AQFNAGDLCHRVPLVGRLERPRQQHFRRHWLRRQPWIDARRSEVNKFAHATTVGSVDRIQRDGEIVGDEFGWKSVVGANAAHLSGSDKYGIRLCARHEAFDSLGLPQIEFAARSANYVAVFPLEAAHDRGADHSGMTGDIDSLAA